MVSEQGLITHVELEIHDCTNDRLFSNPDELGIDWSSIDKLTSEIASPNSWTLEVRVDTNSIDDMRLFAPYLRKEMPRMQSAQRLSAFSRQRLGWTKWEEGLEGHDEMKNAAVTSG